MKDLKIIIMVLIEIAVFCIVLSIMNTDAQVFRAELLDQNKQIIKYHEETVCGLLELEERSNFEN